MSKAKAKKIASAVTQIHGKVIEVSPNVAEQWLAKYRNPENRNGTHVKNNVKKLERAMRKGEFNFTHQPIAFDVNGMLLDGHCRLTALYNTKVTLPFFVIFQAPAGTYESLDSGLTRKPKDRADEGKRYYSTFAAKASKRALFGMKSNQVMADYELLNLIEVHKEPLEVMESLFKDAKANNVKRGGVLGALLRFYYNVDFSMFAEAVTTLATGISTAHGKYSGIGSIDKLYNYLTEIDVRTGEHRIYGGGYKVENSLYRYTEQALFDYMNGVTSATVSQAKSELFEFPSFIKDKHKAIFKDSFGTGLVY